MGSIKIFLDPAIFKDNNMTQTWYGYLMTRNQKVYIGLKTGSTERKWCWDMDIKDASERLHRCFKYFYSNMDENLNSFANDIINKDCKLLAEERWYEDCGLTYKVRRLNER